MMQQVYKSFPNNIPITSICIVEDPSKCPPEYMVVAKTHDQDSDADLWRESSFFGRRISRYLCFSKSEAIMDYIVENISVINEKDNPPEGFSHIPRTVDGDSKAWRKKQICYSYVRRTFASSAVTDIILLSKTKKPPEGFALAGEINGITVCFKTNPIQVNGTSISPAPVGVNKCGKNKSGYPRLSFENSPSIGDYVNLVPVRPAPTPPPNQSKEPAPLPPQPSPNYATLPGHQELNGIPFVLHPSLRIGSSNVPASIPVIKAKTKHDLNKQYDYDFRLERETCT